MGTEKIKIGLVIMASGLGKRFGGNKLMEKLDNRPLVQWILDASEGIFDRRIVVTRSPEVKALCDERGTRCILHDLPHRNDTVRLGLGRIMDDVDYCFFAPGDQPLIGRDTMEKLVLEAENHSDRIVRPCCGDTAGAPVGFPKAFFDVLMNLPEGKGGNVIVSQNPAFITTVEVSEEYELWDVDTKEDLERIQMIMRRRD